MRTFNKSDVMGIIESDVTLAGSGQVIPAGTKWHLDAWTGEFEMYLPNSCGGMEWQVVHGDDESMTLAQLATTYEGLEAAAREWGAEYGKAFIEDVWEKYTPYERERDAGYDWPAFEQNLTDGGLPVPFFICSTK